MSNFAIEAATKITTLIGLIAFLIACMLVAYIRKLKSDEAIAIKADPKNISLIKQYVPVNSENLTRQKQFELALEQIRTRDKNFSRLFIVVVLITLCLFAYSVLTTWIVQRADQKITPLNPQDHTSIDKSSKPRNDPPPVKEERINKLKIEPSNVLASFGPQDNCDSNSSQISNLEVSAFVSSDHSTGCTFYVLARFRPFDDSLDIGEQMKYSLFTKYTGSVPPERSGEVFEVSPKMSLVLSPIKAGETEIILKNNHDYEFRLNPSIGRNESPANRKTQIRLSRNK